MDKGIEVVSNTGKKEDEVYTQFVNDGCGDVLWDDVLKALEETEKEKLNKSANAS